MRSCVALLILVLAASPALAGDVLDGWTRTGSVYSRIDMDEGTPQACSALCDGDNQCRAWVWSRAGIEGPYARCALLWASSTPRRAPGRVTGMASDIAAYYEAASERPPSEREIIALREAEARIPRR